MYTIIAENEAQNEIIAADLAACMRAPLLCGLKGTLGMGKSSLVRAILGALGVRDKIKSPTYSLCELYETSKGPAAHLDCYRLGDFEEVELIGFRDLFETPHLIFIEWPEIVQDAGVQFDIMMTLEVYDEGRKITLDACSENGTKLINMLRERVAE